MGDGNLVPFLLILIVLPCQGDVTMEKKTKEKTSAGEELFGWAQSLIWALLALVLISSFFVRISGVSGSSMYPTLKNNDRVLVRLSQSYQPERGDLIVVMAPNYDPEPLVKRVIALAGDVVEVEEGGIVFVNGEELTEGYVNEAYFGPGDREYPYTVPEGCVFVMGDNRNHSADSRLTMVGALKESDIIGKVFFRIWPIGSFGGI